MKIYDTLIIGGGPAGLSCAITLGSASKKPFALDKKIGIFTHQQDSAMNQAIFYNALGIMPGTKGKEILAQGLKHLTETYPHIKQFKDKKVVKIEKKEALFVVSTPEEEFLTIQIVVAVSPSEHLNIEGLESYVLPHPKIPAVKKRIMLKNTDHLVAPGFYVAGVLAGHRSQFSIASGSGAAVATDILSVWNDGNHTMIHDVLAAEK